MNIIHICHMIWFMYEIVIIICIMLSLLLFSVYWHYTESLYMPLNIFQKCDVSRGLVLPHINI